jgi:phosphoribosylformylglycinamidine synthase
LGINIPTGKDSLSMTQKYPDGEKVFAPGTVIVSAAAEVSDIRKVVEPVLTPADRSELIYVELFDEPFALGGSSFGQVMNAIGSEVSTLSDPNYFARVFAVIQTMVQEGSIRAGHDIASGGLITSLLEMTFGRNDTGFEADLSQIPEQDLVKILFSEKPGIILQVDSCQAVEDHFNQAKIKYYPIGKVLRKREASIKKDDILFYLDLDKLRSTWYRTSYLLDRKQTGELLAKERSENYSRQELSYTFPENFSGSFEQLSIDLHRKTRSGLNAAIIREKGVNGDREMAWMMHLAGFDVKDVHMTDLIEGRETLEDIHFIVFVGGFSNSDVLGSAKGWAGAFLYNEKARQALDRFYARKDTLSLGICNGCQVMVELDLIYPEHSKKPVMKINASGKFESAFLNVTIQENKSVMMRNLSGTRLGIWVAHGEGRFSLPYEEGKYHIPVKYSYDKLPGNPNGSDYQSAAICSHDGRHLAMMPHLERAIYPWNWAHYPSERKYDEITPWIMAFVNAREWVREKKSRS